jgi:hypothetical protein
VRELVDAMLDEARAAILHGRLDEAFVQALQARFEALPVLTEADLREQLLAPVRAIELVAEHAGDDCDVLAHLDGLRAQAAAAHERLFGRADTPYLQSRAVVAALADAKRQATEPDSTLAQALATLEAIAFDDTDASAKVSATLALHALNSYWRWQHSDGPRDEQDKAVKALRRLQRKLDRRGLDSDWIKDAIVAGCTVYPLADGTTAMARAAVAMGLLGMALDRQPDALPGLQPLCDLISESLTFAARAAAPQAEGGPSADGADEPHAAQDTRRSGDAGQEPEFTARCEAILQDFEQRVQANGFSQYELEQSVAQLRGLETSSADDAATLNRTLVGLIDRALPHAPPDGQAALQAARESLVHMATLPAAPLSTAEVESQCETIVEQLEQALAAGENASGSLTRAITALQLLGQRLPDGDEQAAMTLMQAMPRIMAAAAGAAPPELQALAEQMSAHVEDLFAAAPRMMGSEGDEQSIEVQAAQRMLGRLAATATNDPADSQQADPLLRQFGAALRPWLARLATLHDLPTGTQDAAEAQRLAKRADIALQRARAATTEAQLVEQMRMSLRPLALQLRRFERRRHLTLIDPPWPAQAVVDDPNAVFTSAGPAVQALVDNAAQRLGMTPPAQVALDDPTHARWLRLRAAAVAVFDFSAYDRARADPGGALPRDDAAQAAILQAAAPVAMVAFEAGWALLQGVPMVIVVNEGQAAPFDIDIEPVRLRADGGDAARLAEAIVTALFGTQRGSPGDGLAHMLAALRAKAAHNAPALSLLKAVPDTGDALRVQFAAQATLELLRAPSSLLVCAAFPAQAAPAGRVLFHVSGFRDWSLPVQQAVRKACRRAGIDYRIGHEDLDPAILRAVWSGLAQASFVVADLTTLNPNAVLELAIAQAMGRPTLILSRHADTASALPALQKVRIHRYDIDAAGLRALGRLLDRFLTGAVPVPG